MAVLFPAAGALGLALLDKCLQCGGTGMVPGYTAASVPLNDPYGYSVVSVPGVPSVPCGRCLHGFVFRPLTPEAFTAWMLAALKENRKQLVEIFKEGVSDCMQEK